MTPVLRSLVVAMLLVGVSCTPSYVVVPASGGNIASAKGAGLVMQTVPNAWDDEPSDLNHYMTPIWIQLVNRGTTDVRVVYSDFALTNSSGFRYAAISPYPQRSQVPTSLAEPSKLDAATALAEPSEWYFDKGRPSEETVQLVPIGDGTAQVELVRGARMGGGHLGGGHLGGRVYVGPHYGGGAYGQRHLYHSYGYYSPWPYFYAWPPFYGPYVYYWGPRYYPIGPSDAVMQRGLPEGVLHAGGAVSGFVYFQHAATHTTGLDLTFAAHSADGKRITTLHAPLEVVEE